VWAGQQHGHDGGAAAGRDLGQVLGEDDVAHAVQPVLHVQCSRMISARRWARASANPRLVTAWTVDIRSRTGQHGAHCCREHGQLARSGTAPNATSTSSAATSGTTSLHPASTCRNRDDHPCCEATCRRPAAHQGVAYTITSLSPRRRAAPRDRAGPLGARAPCSRRKRGATWDPLPQRQTNRNRSSVAATALQTPLGAISEGGPQVDEHDADAGVPSA
jgi:hypothetical protein